MENKEVVEKKEVTKEKEVVEKKKKEENIAWHYTKLVFNIIFWVAIVILLVLWVTDFMNVSKSKEPRFCIKNNVYKYDDGKIYECVGAGYKVVKYERTSKPKSIEFVPFFVKVRK
ncbi:MAG: hypothetical protein RSE91_02100 [Bacilli bacterium]